MGIFLETSSSAMNSGHDNVAGASVFVFEENKRQGTHEIIYESLQTPLLLGSSLQKDHDESSSLQKDHDEILHSDQQDSQVIPMEEQQYIILTTSHNEDKATLRPDGVTFFRALLNGLNVLAGWL